jgi:hypothetical protein
VRLKAVFSVGGVGAALALPLWGPPALRPFAFFAVRRVELVGTRYLAPDVIVGALALRPAASVWDRLGPMADRVRQVPGVAEAAVGRRLPGTLRVSVREVEPVALAMGAEGLVPVAADGRPLPYDPARVSVDAPVVQRADSVLVRALDAVRTADPALYATIASARTAAGGELQLEVEDRGRLRMAIPVSPEVVRAIAAVERDLESRSQAWRELDGRFGGWVVVRRPGKAEASS